MRGQGLSHGPRNQMQVAAPAPMVALSDLTNRLGGRPTSKGPSVIPVPSKVSEALKTLAEYEEQQLRQQAPPRTPRAVRDRKDIIGNARSPPNIRTRTHLGQPQRPNAPQVHRPGGGAWPPKQLWTANTRSNDGLASQRQQQKQPPVNRRHMTTHSTTGASSAPSTPHTTSFAPGPRTTTQPTTSAPSTPHTTSFAPAPKSPGSVQLRGKAQMSGCVSSPVFSPYMPRTPKQNIGQPIRPKSANPPRVRAGLDDETCSLQSFSVGVASVPPCWSPGHGGAPRRIVDIGAPARRSPSAKSVRSASARRSPSTRRDAEVEELECGLTSTMATISTKSAPSHLVGDCPRTPKHRSGIALGKPHRCMASHVKENATNDCYKGLSKFGYNGQSSNKDLRGPSPASQQRFGFVPHRRRVLEGSKMRAERHENNALTQALVETAEKGSSFVDIALEALECPPRAMVKSQTAPKLPAMTPPGSPEPRLQLATPLRSPEPNLQLATPQRSPEPASPLTELAEALRSPETNMQLVTAQRSPDSELRLNSPSLLSIGSEIHEEVLSPIAAPGDDLDVLPSLVEATREYDEIEANRRPSLLDLSDLPQFQEPEEPIPHVDQERILDVDQEPDGEQAGRSTQSPDRSNATGYVTALLCKLCEEFA